MDVVMVCASKSEGGGSRDVRVMCARRVCASKSEGGGSRDVRWTRVSALFSLFLGLFRGFLGRRHGATKSLKGVVAEVYALDMCVPWASWASCVRVVCARHVCVSCVRVMRLAHKV